MVCAISQCLWILMKGRSVVSLNQFIAILWPFYLILRLKPTLSNNSYKTQRNHCLQYIFIIFSLLLLLQWPSPHYLLLLLVYVAVLTTVNFQDLEHGKLMCSYLENVSQPGMPVLVMEFWTGWFDHWGERHHIVDNKSQQSILAICILTSMQNTVSEGTSRSRTMTCSCLFHFSVAIWCHFVSQQFASTVTERTDYCKQLVITNFT